MSEAIQLPELGTNHEAEQSHEWLELIELALTVPGSLGNTYNRFYNYSFMNQVLLFMQGVQEPVATYKRWQQLGRQVQKGSKAKTIMRPLFFKALNEQGEEVQKLRGFKYVNCLFTLSETTGEELPPYEPANWSPDTALKNLDIEEVPFQLMDGNTQGYSYKRKLAVNPVAPYPLKTLAHEAAHIVLGHTSDEGHAEYQTHRGHMEFEAEATALLVMKEVGALEHMNESESRAYIQGWLRKERPSDKSVRKVFGAVETILKAGRGV
jgi:antirestriction protein ArdC